MAANTKNVRNVRMKAVRINNGNLTQKQAAAKIGFTTQYYSRVERGLIDGCIDFWRHFAEAFEIPDSNVWEIINNIALTINATVPSICPVTATKRSRNVNKYQHNHSEV